MTKDTNAKITIVDPADHGLNAEQNAMFMALCSRSTEGPEANLAKVKEKGAEKFMAQVYIGYGHSSVGKMGRTNIFFKGVSMLAAKELQANSLYIGQESSTRYITFSKEGVQLPVNKRAKAKSFTDRLMDLYLRANDSVYEHVLAKYPLPVGNDKGTWERGLKAHTFDITRSILPSGCKTTVGWCGNLEEISQQLPILYGSVYDEVRELAVALYEELKAVYPSSFSDFDKTYNFDDYNYVETTVTLQDSTLCVTGDIHPFFTDPERKRKTIIPLAISESATVEYCAELDFGSFRDIQRHRNGYVQRGPFLGALSSWYLDNMPEDIAIEFNALATEIYDWQEEQDPYSDSGRYAYDYVMPMGTVCDVYCKFPIGNAVYVAELRSGVAVHPTARAYALDMLAGMEEHGMTMHADKRPFTAFITKRANDDIVNKN